MKLRGSWRRFLPRTLLAQTVALLFAAVLGAQTAGWLLYMNEREFAARKVHLDQTMSRIAAAVRLVGAVPPAIRNDALQASSSKEFKFWFTSRPEADGKEISEEATQLRNRLALTLSQPAETVLLHLQRADAPPASTYPPGFADAAVMASVRLADGHWLNAATFRYTRPPGWGEAALASVAATLIATAIAGAVLARRIAHPLRSLATAAERLGRGESVPALEHTRGPDEVRRAALAFNQMGERLRRFVQDRTRMLAAISHDLRTPITSLRLRAELIDDAETRTKMLETLEELAATAEAALAFAREEAGEETRLVDLSSLVECICEDIAELGAAPVLFRPSEKLPYACRSASLRRAVRNLVENAVAYGGGAHVALEWDRQDIKIIVEDDGPGVPDGDVDRIFEPFVRLEASRNRRTGGVGLGLSIARTIVRAHGGDILLANRQEGGFRATIVLPRHDGTHEAQETTRTDPIETRPSARSPAAEVALSATLRQKSARS
ncbi:MAG TPA: ATP-binding protein [Xanthobacteraceae bacterium]|nr:ATP-binding protein [Xanthobacteraceae bacterium]